MYMQQKMIREIVKKMFDPNIDLRKELIIYSPDGKVPLIKTPVQGSTRIASYSSNSAVIEYESSVDAFLYVSDTYYPGWRAYVDGKETKIYRANLAFRAVEVPKGKHTVVFKYVPMSFYIGLCLTIIGILLCIWLWRRDKKDNVQLPNFNNQV